MTIPSSARPGRNDPCHCGSGRKYKHCCLEKDEAKASDARAKAAKAAAKAAAAAAEGAAQSAKATTSAPPPAPKPQTHQPWKATASRGFIPRARTTPRKVGGG